MYLNPNDPHIMGILNITPDSFYDGGAHNSIEKAIAHANDMVSEGATIIDIGGESTRPGALPVAANEQINRVIPIIKTLVNDSSFNAILSCDTSSPVVMKSALQAGATLINDVNALQSVSDFGILREYQPYICLMHKLGTPKNMQNNPTYTNVVQQIHSFLQKRVNVCLDEGIDINKIIVDPGFGFGKTVQDNLSILANLNQFKDLSPYLLAGISRKSMFGKMFDLDVDDRLTISVVAAMQCMQKGSNILRVHDVKHTKDAIQLHNSCLEFGEY